MVQGDTITMSIFGDFETPPAALDLSLKLHRAVYDPPSCTVQLHATAKASLSDGRTESGVSVAFFLNGEHFADVETDEFGLAVLSQDLPWAKFHADRPNELTARIRGVAREWGESFPIVFKRVAIGSIKHRWSRSIRVTWSTTQCHSTTRYEDLLLSVACKASPANFDLAAIEVELEVRGVENGERRIKSLSKSRLDKTGNCTFALPELYYDGWALIHPRPLDKSGRIYRASDGGQLTYDRKPSGFAVLANTAACALTLRIVGWPDEYAPLVQVQSLQDFGSL